MSGKENIEKLHFDRIPALYSSTPRSESSLAWLAAAVSGSSESEVHTAVPENGDGADMPRRDVSQNVAAACCKQRATLLAGGLPG